MINPNQIDYSKPRTRINGSLMSTFKGKQVHLLCKCISIDGTGRHIKVKCTDDPVILVALSQPLHQPIDPDTLIEVEGIPESNNKIRCINLNVFPLEMSEKFDCGLYNELITMMQTTGQANTIQVTNIETHIGSFDVESSEIQLLNLEHSTENHDDTLNV